MIQVSCVSGTINRLPLLKRMVESVRRSVGSLRYEIILVDCNSSDGTRTWCRQQKDVVLIEHPEPRGSAIAFQDGFEHARGTYVQTLNDDVAVDGRGILKAYQYLETHPEVGQVAFYHKYQNRKGVDKTRGRVQKAFGYTYAQCGMTRRWLGDLAGWCGVKTDGYIHYGWDNYLSCRVWEMGYRVVPVEGCAVIDWEHEDAIRTKFSDKLRSEGGGAHSDTKRFMQIWKGRLPPPGKWKPVHMGLEQMVLWKASRRVLRTLRFKGMMRASQEMRTAMIDAFGEYGPTRQVNQSAKMRELGQTGYQSWALSEVRSFKPDLVILQAQRANNILPQTVAAMRRTFPNTYVINWDGDTHYPITKFHYNIAASCHLQLVVSPSLFPQYVQHGAPNIGYWPIAVEQEYIDVARARGKKLNGPDVVFLGSLFGVGMFPEAITRQKAVQVLHKSGLKFKIHGGGWHQVGIRATYTGESHTDNAKLYARSKMALSISQTKDHWGYTSDRGYNILATGCPMLIQRFVGMREHGLVDGVSCIAWTTFKEMLDKARYYLKHPVEREEIGRRGKELVLTRHNWKERVKRLFAILGGLEKI